MQLFNSLILFLFIFIPYISSIGIRKHNQKMFEKGIVPFIFPFTIKDKSVIGLERFFSFNFDHTYTKNYGKLSCRRELFEENIDVSNNLHILC